MSGNTTYLQAIKNPIVKLKTSIGNLKVINSDIPFDDFKIEFDNVGTRSLKAYAYTPRMEMYSVGCADDDETKLCDLQFMHQLYTNQEVMRKYEYGVTYEAAAINKRYSWFEENWQVKRSPLSGFICYSEHERVGFFNISDVNLPGTAEFAAISDLKYWNQGFASEVGLLLYKYPKMIRDSGYKLADGTELEAVTATARPDNGSAFVMDKLGLTCVRTEIKYGAERKVFLNTIDELQSVVDNTNVINSLGILKKHI